ncbi:MAG: 16S rRNA (adenine(1518)-N(6)/adenine(1519)-N(6))-dimethyltransferase RsmA [Gammaproteobacteria bacterium]|nr:16S rRNA (adenine(1518)-N(6)/adenine(1519)-N(6))-dimethyltransferase RsmA [Gammaproteobacteria bacterium]MDE2251067.1 16S rRNA (adenine(1518)-N(6)/adenine(1519)-N(6))-dimethyltransferase RsmA [Gammaproteobacteria bacterium]
MRARKRFGQHFLHDPAVIERIVSAIAPRSGEALVEIGPGHGALTNRLLAAGASLDVIEIDRELAAALRARQAGLPHFTVHEADALGFDFAALARTRGQRLRVIGNLPYNISTPLLFRLLEAGAALLDMHFMLQKEVVERIVAAPGSRQYGRLGVMLAPRVRATQLLEAGPGAFRPPPRVWSAVVRLEIRPDPPAWATLPQYAAVVGAAFGQRRKTLRNALSGLLSAARISAAGIDPGARAETLAAADFGRLALAVAGAAPL